METDDMGPWTRSKCLAEGCPFEVEGPVEVVEDEEDHHIEKTGHDTFGGKLW